jgi:hypothetical protein
LFALPSAFLVLAQVRSEGEMNNAAASDYTGIFNGAWQLLQYGPIGFAALMLVLVVIALMIPGADAARLALMKFLLKIGTFCFVVACIFAFLPTYIQAGHLVHFRIEPLDSGQTQALPRPIVTINGEVLNPPPHYLVASEVTAIIDVSDAISFVNQYKERDAKQASLLNGVSAQITSSVPKLQEIAKIATSDACPGGAHGIPIPNGPTLAAHSSSILANFQSTQAAIAAVLNEPPPQ